MECLSPIMIRNEKYRSDPDPNARPWIPVPCGKCFPCLQRRAAGWANRLLCESYVARSTWFVTLTYDNDHVPVFRTFTDPIKNGLVYGFEDGFSCDRDRDFVSACLTLQKSDVQKFFQRFRHKISCPIKFYCCAEYGSHTARPHYHFILFLYEDYERDHLAELIGSSWTLGMTRLDASNEKTIRYVTKYVCKRHPDHMERMFSEGLAQRPFSLMSKKLGISYIENSLRFHEHVVEHCYFLLDDGSKSVLPRYFRDKLYTVSERKRIAEYFRKAKEKDFFFVEDYASMLKIFRKDFERKKNYVKTMEHRLKERSTF